MEHYVILSSNAFNDIYPSNTPYQFYADLNEELQLDDRWKVALVELDQSREHDLYVYCNFSKECFVNNSKKSLLRFVSSNGDISRLYYHYVKKFRIQRELEFTLRLKDGSAPKFLVEPTIVMLHFKRYPI
jgi:hypothetical protein